MLKALHHEFGCNSQAGVLRVFTPADVSISNATATGTKKSQAERYLACGATVSTFRQTETRPALTGFRKTAHTHTQQKKETQQTSLLWVNRRCNNSAWEGLHLLYPDSPKPQLKSSSAVWRSWCSFLIQRKTRASMFWVTSSLTFCTESIYSACTKC